MPASRARWALAVVAGVGLLAGGVAHAQLYLGVVGKTVLYQQTGPSTETPLGGYFTAQMFFQQEDELSGGSFTPSPNPYGQIFTGPVVFCCGGKNGNSFQSATLALSTLNSDYATGATYELTASSPRRNYYQTVAVDFAQDVYTADIPALSAASFAALQDASRSIALTLDFNSFTPNADATVSQGSFTILDPETYEVVFSDDDFSPTTTSLTIPAGTLTPGQDYEYTLTFDDRVTGASDGVATAYFSDVSTIGDFDAPLPEPTAWLLMTLGVAGIGGLSRRRRAQSEGVSLWR